MFDFSIINIEENGSEVEVVIEPIQSKKGQVSIETFWSQDNDLRQEIEKMGIKAEYDSDKIIKRIKDITQIEKGSSNFIPAMKYWVPFIKRE